MIYDLRIFKKSIFVAAAIIIGGALLMILLKQGGRDYSNEQLETLAKCLSEKNIVMYGNYNCSHCLREKAAFKDAFQFIRYVECRENIKLCINAEINVVPTWIFPDSRKLTGAQGIERLAKESGCIIK